MITSTLNIARDIGLRLEGKYGGSEGSNAYDTEAMMRLDEELDHDENDKKNNPRGRLAPPLVLEYIVTSRN